MNVRQCQEKSLTSHRSLWMAGVKDMRVFRGIRYARAEMFGKPVQENLPEEFDFDGYAAESVVCPQTPSRLSRILGDISNKLPMSFDCLRVSIFTPDLAGSRPVLVFFHGGAYLTGSGEYDSYDASRLAGEGDIVVVNASYRLGASGFLYQPDKGSVDLGIEDQMCALRWVKANVARFGGNAEDLTLCGQSAGAYSVLNIIARQTGLFNKAIVMSAPFALRPNKKKALRMRDAFFESLENQDVPSFLAAQQKAQAVGQVGMPFMPMEEKAFFKADRVPGLTEVLLTYQKDDASAFVSGKILNRIGTSFIFKSPLYRYARHLEKKGVAARIIEFDWHPAGNRLGACHTLELPFLFGSWENWKDAPMLAGTSKEEYEARGRELRKIIVSFVRPRGFGGV